MCNQKANGVSPTVSSTKVSRSEDAALDKAQPKTTSGMAGITVASGSAGEAMDIDAPSGNKRKSRSSIAKVSYKDASESDGEPLVSVLSFMSSQFPAFASYLS